MIIQEIVLGHFFRYLETNKSNSTPFEVKNLNTKKINHGNVSNMDRHLSGHKLQKEFLST